VHQGDARMEDRTSAVASEPADHSAADRPDVPGEPGQSKLEAPDDLKCSHGPNFGRYVAGCPKCEWKKANGLFAYKKPKKPPRPPKREIAGSGEGVHLSYEQLQALMEKAAG